MVTTKLLSGKRSFLVTNFIASFDEEIWDPIDIATFSRASHGKLKCHYPTRELATFVVQN